MVGKLPLKTVAKDLGWLLFAMAIIFIEAVILHVPNTIVVGVISGITSSFMYDWIKTAKGK